MVRKVWFLTGLVAFAGCAQHELPVACAPGSDVSIDRVVSNLRTTVQVSGEPPIEETHTLAERMREYDVPGVSIAIVDNGRIAWACGFGVTQVGADIPVSDATLFQAASMSKPVAATGMLRMVDEGLLSLDRPANDFLESWKIPESRFSEETPVTLRQMASHNAGLTVHGFAGYAFGQPVPSLIDVLEGRPPANSAPIRVDTVPGDLFRYSGGGYTVLQLLMSDVAGEPFAALMDRLVFEPLTMTNSTFEQPLPDSLLFRAAAGHGSDGYTIRERWRVHPEQAAAGLWTTPTDLLKWAVGVADSWAGKPGALLRHETAVEMLTAQAGHTGIGPILGGHGGAAYFEHSGSNVGYRGHVIYFPETGQGAAVMTNADRGNLIAREVLLAAGAEYKWPDYSVVNPVTIGSRAASRYLGEYGAGQPNPLMLIVTYEDGTLFVEDPAFLPRQELMITGPNRGRVRSGLEFVFQGNDSGPAQSVETMGYRLDRRDYPRDVWVSYTGTYRMENGLMATVSLDGPGLRLSFGPDQDRTFFLIPESATEFWIRGVTHVEFENNGSSATMRVVIQEPNAAAVSGSRVR